MFWYALTFLGGAVFGVLLFIVFALYLINDLKDHERNPYQ